MTDDNQHKDGRRRVGIGRAIGGVVDGALDAAVNTAEAALHTAGHMGKALGSALGMGRRHHHEFAPKKPGRPPGIEFVPDVDTPPRAGTVTYEVIDYSADRVERRTIDDLPAFLDQRRPDWVKVRWLNINGLHPWVVHQLQKHYEYHTLAAEDVVNVPQRPRIEGYDDHLFIVARMLSLHEGEIDAEQVTFFFFSDTLITFQEKAGDIFDGVRQRIDRESSRLRTNGTGYLLYALLDALVDQCFPILESFGDALETIEDHVMENPRPKTQQEIQHVKRQLVLLRRVLWPTRQMIDDLQRDEGEVLSKTAKTYLRDVHEHALQLIDVIESYREMAGGLNDLYMSVVSNRMNEIMKVLTIIATIFIPLSFIAGVYGMNFDHIPELHQRWAYPVFWIVCITITLGLLTFFFRKGWLGGGR